MRLVSFLSSLILLFVFGGCAIKQPYSVSKPYHVVIKNRDLALSDTGFIKKDSSRLNLQLFSAGSPLLDLIVYKDRVCRDLLCMNKLAFNKKFFGYKHYESFVDDLFNFLPLYEKKNIKKTKNGFTQKLVSDYYDIFYKIKDGSLYFKDRKNRVLIKIKELK